MIASVLGAAALLYGLILAGMYFGQRSLIYLPDTSTPAVSEGAAWGFSEVRIGASDGFETVSWYRPAAEGQPTVVYFHGNGGHIGHRADKVRPYGDAGLGVLLVGYRGYGGNPGQPTEAGLYRDASAAIAFLRAEGVAPKDIALYGESLGSGVAVETAWSLARRGGPVAAVILEAPFSSLADMAQFHYPFLPARWLVKDRFESTSKIGDIDAPLLVVHGEADRVIPLRFGMKLFDAAAEPKQLVRVPGAGHNDLYENGVAEAVLAFLGRVREPSAP